MTGGISASWVERLLQDGSSPVKAALLHHDAIGRELCRRAGCTDAFPRPLQLARGLGLAVDRLSPLSPAEVMVRDHVLLYRPSSDARRDGLLVFLGIAEIALRRYARATATDTWLLVAELVAPRAAAHGRDFQDLVERQPYAPEWLLRMRRDRLPTDRSACPIAKD